MVDNSSRLNFTFGNEDWQCEEEALRIEPAHRVLCITASGDRPLHALLANPAHVIAVDDSAGHNHLLQLKRAAMRLLPFDEYLAFLGAAPHEDRLTHLPRLHEAMSQDTSTYWKRNSQFIRQGVLFQGNYERTCHYIAKCMHLLRGSVLRQLFAFTCLDAQRQFVKDTWDRKSWRTCFRWLFRFAPRIMRSLSLEPVLLEPIQNTGDAFYQRITEVLMTTLARKNHFLSLVFNGTIQPEAFVPYLTQAGVDVIKSRLDRLSIHTADIVTFLETAPSNSVDRFSLSDVAAGASKESFARLLQEVHRVGRPGARFCTRQFYTDSQVPTELQSNFMRESELETSLNRKDISCCSKFMIGTVHKSA